jgi:SagB-type dehydrogenase family enzyme
MTGKRMRGDVVCVAILMALSVGCQDAAAGSSGPQAPPAQVEPVTLPPARTTGPLPLETAIYRRRSQRDFAPGALTPEEISQLAWAAQGITDKERGLRASPSAGALYPLELYVVDAQGVWHYDPAQNALRRIATGDRRADLMHAAVGQSPVGAAAANLVLTGVMARSRPRYKDRAERYVYIEAGHAAENALLEATALGLAAVPVAAFDDDAMRRVLGVGAAETPLYILSVGRPPP